NNTTPAPPKRTSVKCLPLLGQDPVVAFHLLPPQSFGSFHVYHLKNDLVPGFKMGEPIMVNLRYHAEPCITADGPFVQHQNRQSLAGNLDRARENTLGDDALLHSFSENQRPPFQPDAGPVRV